MAACQMDECEGPGRDWGMETFGLTLPMLPAPDFSVFPQALVEQYYQGPARLPVLLTQRDFAGLQAYWDEIAAIKDPSEQTQAMLLSLDIFNNRGLYLVNAAQAWYQQHPESPAAQLMLAAAYRQAAIEASRPYYMVRDSDEYAGKAYRRILDSRIALVRPFLNALMQKKDIYGMAARHLNLYIGAMEGKGEAAWQSYLETIAYAPQNPRVYLHAVQFAGPNWSNSRNMEPRFATLTDLAKQNNLPEVEQIGLWQEIESTRHDPATNPNPQAWRPHWQARVKAAPTLNNYLGWLQAEEKVSNWPAVLELSDNVLALNPNSRLAWEARGEALRYLGSQEEAYQANVVATLVGGNQALQKLIVAHVTGGYGFKVRDLDAMYRYCKAGAALGLPAGANCMGSAHSEAFAGIARSDREALRWHLLGARGDHTNSQHDVVVILPRVITDPAQASAVDHTTGYWVRLAALYGHGPAKNKLAARPEWGEECRPPVYMEYLKKAFWLIRAFL